MHHLACAVDAMFKECRADQRFHDVAQNRALLCAALCRFAVTQQNIRFHMQLGACNGAQRFLAHRLGAHLRQFAFAHIGVQAEQRLGGYEFQYGIAQEFESFVMFCARMLVCEGTMGERLDQQIGADGGAERLQQFVCGRLGAVIVVGACDWLVLCFVCHDPLSSVFWNFLGLSRI